MSARIPVLVVLVEPLEGHELPWGRSGRERAVELVDRTGGGSAVADEGREVREDLARSRETVQAPRGARAIIVPSSACETDAYPPVRVTWTWRMPSGAAGQTLPSLM